MNLDNHPKRGILKDIDMNTLMRMRTEEGMSNREIAEKVGVTYEAIHRIIGKQPKGIRYSAKATRGGREHRDERILRYQTAGAPGYIV